MDATLKATIKEFDQKYLGDSLRKLNRLRWKLKTGLGTSKFLQNKYIKKLNKNYPTDIDLRFMRKDADLLTRLFDTYGSSKGYLYDSDTPPIQAFLLLMANAIAIFILN